MRGLDLTVAQGEMFGFLGPNGCGKTTTIAMLCTLVPPTAGRAEVCGHDTRTAPGAVRRGIGLVFQESTLDPELTVEENLRFHGDLYGLPRAGLPHRVGEVLDLVELSGHRAHLVRTLSGGMRRRLEIARGILHRPRVLFLDEPAIGLDPHARARVWAHLRDISRHEGTTLFLTTHYLDEADHCDRVAIVDSGRIVTQGAPAELKAVLGADRVELRTADNPAAARVLRDRFGLAASAAGDTLTLRARNAAGLVPRLCADLGVAVHAVSVARPTLDDVFMHHTGHPATAAGGAAPAPGGAP
ncbi:ATP-binding cassette domain-containing protein [Streptomonospora sp. S1-112]|uniref:ATP-binding cassette domain-containing protein n=1 Tax=Streptomonospora mangrovi TaxID=2883123 RepID=A0A9X3SFJ3_9ACTN|nr:ATP-binding cassette domain-containing protein [Streptomonospora mangrovi]MDA0566908.1 ATP-binding cassette domain-containing protein [Streptomonospora mangrovi]